MNSREKSRVKWTGVRRRLVETGVSTASIPRESFPHPRDAGARPTSTQPIGQIADHALELMSGEAPLVVREFDHHFEAYVDGMQLTTHAADVASEHPSAAMYVGGALFGGAVGAAISNKRGGALLGAGLGILFAAAVDAALTDKKVRE